MKLKTQSEQTPCEALPSESPNAFPFFEHARVHCTGEKAKAAQGETNGKGKYVNCARLKQLPLQNFVFYWVQRQGTAVSGSLTRAAAYLIRGRLALAAMLS